MKNVIVHPERCIGCMQCMFACAVAHSRSRSAIAAASENPLPQARVHIGAGLYREGFPNRCRHCNPAPCLLACLPGAIYEQPETASVLIDPDRCINCASCAMACPYGVVRYHQDQSAAPGKTVAIKCDNCVERQARGLAPACTEACKTGALTFEEEDRAYKRKTDEIARTVSAGPAEKTSAPAGVAALHAVKRAQCEIEERSCRIKGGFHE
jgi:carbon-monoxide dehydrogenase iron sulfur subunit